MDANDNDVLMSKTQNRQETKFCYFLKIGKKRDTVLLENRQETGFCIIGK